ncbi:craniofacial development protein 1 isoform X1 [Dermochelys coriacea]|uniref:craniofacial development protein 1 isoform X1 n=1 Tax=Dermochelys coriacea TaxID=27794 RepID=UPI001CAA3366|nr:craniofacial development protein 1 isoform X1 [Dermochelys coriacea]
MCPQVERGASAHSAPALGGCAGEEYSEDDVSELVKEDEDEEKPYKEKGKKSSKGTVCRKRERGGLLLLPGEREESKDQQSDSEEADSLRQVKGSRAEEEEKKKKEDALWASFLSDVGQKSKAPPAAQLTSPQTNKTTEEKSSSKLQEEAKEPAKPKDMAKVTITKVFDFAGEEVRVTKEVDAASKEAKSFLKQQEKEKAQPAAPASLPTVSGVKRPTGISSLLGMIGSKKQKMSTLEKSKLDWENFKEEEGIGEDLAIHNRGKEGSYLHKLHLGSDNDRRPEPFYIQEGWHRSVPGAGSLIPTCLYCKQADRYIDRKAFLERVDHRQFEIERDIRLSKTKP